VQTTKGHPSPTHPTQPPNPHPNTSPPHTAQSIISGLRQFEDEGAQLSALTELSELLSISQEESLAATVPVEQVVPLLVSLSANPRGRRVAGVPTSSQGGSGGSGAP